jgi:hypothetical protein
MGVDFERSGLRKGGGLGARWDGIELGDLKTACRPARRPPKLRRSRRQAGLRQGKHARVVNPWPDIRT